MAHCNIKPFKLGRQSKLDVPKQRQEHTNTVQTQDDTGLLIFYCHIHIYALYSLQGVQNNCG